MKRLIVLFLFMFALCPADGANSRETASREQRLEQFKQAVRESYAKRVKEKLGGHEYDETTIKRIIGDIETSKVIVFSNFTPRDFIAFRKLVYGSIEPPPVLISYGNRKLESYFNRTDHHVVYYSDEENAEVVIIDDYGWFAFNFARYEMPEENNVDPNWLQKIKLVLDYLRDNRRHFPAGLIGCCRGERQYAFFLAGEVLQYKDRELNYPLTLRLDGDDFQIGYFTLDHNDRVREVKVEEWPEIVEAADAIYGCFCGEKTAHDP